MERLRHLPEVTELVCGRIETHNKVFLTPKLPMSPVQLWVGCLLERPNPQGTDALRCLCSDL